MGTIDLPRQDPQTFANLQPADGDSDGVKATKISMLANLENTLVSSALQCVNGGTDTLKTVET